MLKHLLKLTELDPRNGAQVGHVEDVQSPGEHDGPTEQVLKEPWNLTIRRHGVRRTIASTAKLLSPLALALAVSSCWIGGPTHKAWTEDVLLDDGSTILIKRTVSYDESSAWGGGSYNAVEREASLAFTDALKELPLWSVALKPMVLYRDSAANGQWVIVAVTTSCEVWNARGTPVPPYWEYRLIEGDWKEVPLSETSIGRSANVFTGYTLLTNTHVSVREQQAYRDRPGMGLNYVSVNKTLVPRSAEFTCSHDLRRE